jgi:PAS domain S-box-containing protein
MLPGHDHDQDSDIIQKISARAISGDPDKIKDFIEFLLNVVEGSSQPFVIADSRGLIKGCNMAYCRLTGYTSEELLSKKCGEDLTPPEWRIKESEVIAAQIMSKMPAIYEKEYCKKDGSRVYVELYDHIIFDTKGGPLYFYAFVSDLSSQHIKK